MTTSALRAAILVAGVIVGAVIIANAFPSNNPSRAGTHPSSSPSSSPSASPSPAQHAQKLDCSSLSSVSVAVENATNAHGLAAATANRVKAMGYTVNAATDIGDATAKTATSTVFFRTAADKKAARCVRRRVFPQATLKAMSAGGTSASPRFSTSTGVAVFVGSDYAAKHPVG